MKIEEICEQAGVDFGRLKALGFMRAPCSKCRFTFLFKMMPPLKNSPPEGTMTRPPPAAWQASTAAWIAFVFIVFPSETAPYARMSNSIYASSLNAISGRPFSDAPNRRMFSVKISFAFSK